MAGTQYIGEFIPDYLPGTVEESSAAITGEVSYAYGGLLRDAALRNEYGPFLPTEPGSGASATKDRPFLESLALAVPDFLRGAASLVGSIRGTAPNTSAGLVRRVVDPRTGQIVLLPGGQIGGPTSYRQAAPGFLSGNGGINPMLLLLAGGGVLLFLVMRVGK